MNKKTEIMSHYLKGYIDGCPVYNEQSVIGMLNDVDDIGVLDRDVDVDADKKEIERLEGIVISQSATINKLQDELRSLQAINDVLMGIKIKRPG